VFICIFHLFLEIRTFCLFLKKMAETASETASSLQLVRTLINPNGVGRPRTEDDIEPAPTRRAPSPADSFGNEDADSNNDYEMGDVMSQDGVAEAATIATQVTQPPRSRVDFASESMSQARRPYSPMSHSSRVSSRVSSSRVSSSRGSRKTYRYSGHSSRTSHRCSSRKSQILKFSSKKRVPTTSQEIGLPHPILDLKPIRPSQRPIHCGRNTRCSSS